MRFARLGDNIESADVANVLVAVGDTVTVDQDLIEVETGGGDACSKPSRGGEGIRVVAGDKVAVGAVFVVVEEEGASAAPAPAAAPAEADPGEASAPLRLQRVLR